MRTKISTKMCVRYTQAYILTKIFPFFFHFFSSPCTLHKNKLLSFIFTASLSDKKKGGPFFRFLLPVYTIFGLPQY